MIRLLGLSIAGTIAVASTAMAQQSPPSYQADPDTYKVIFEDQNFRVIAATWKKGATDKPHSHSLPFVVYPLTDCTLRIRSADGTSREIPSKAGVVSAGPIVASHTGENVGEADCRAIFVERK